MGPVSNICIRSRCRNIIFCDWDFVYFYKQGVSMELLIISAIVAIPLLMIGLFAIYKERQADSEAQNMSKIS
jgi:hypothetical protein